MVYYLGDVYGGKDFKIGRSNFLTILKSYFH